MSYKCFFYPFIKPSLKYNKSTTNCISGKRIYNNLVIYGVFLFAARHTSVTSATQLRAAGGSWDTEYLHYKHHFGEKAKGEKQPATPQTMQQTENDQNLR